MPSDKSAAFSSLPEGVWCDIPQQVGQCRYRCGHLGILDPCLPGGADVSHQLPSREDTAAKILRHRDPAPFPPFPTISRNSLLFHQGAAVVPSPTSGCQDVQRKQQTLTAHVFLRSILSAVSQSKPLTRASCRSLCFIKGFATRQTCRSSDRGITGIPASRLWC